MNTVFYCLLAFPGNYVILNKMNLTERKGNNCGDTSDRNTTTTFVCFCLLGKSSNRIERMQKDKL